MQKVRRPAVAGSFYPANAERLARMVDELLERVPRAAESQIPKALIVPHAGYIYSGPIAATAYAQLRPAADRIRRAVILGPSHFAPIAGLAFPDATAVETPLGEVAMDMEALQAASLSGVHPSAAAHAEEHSLEVQLPFLQRVLKSFRVLPFAVGYAESEQVAAVIDAWWEDPGTVILVSSDLSHYLRYESAVEMDQRTAMRIVELGPGDISHEEACGATPINGLLHAARRRRLRSRLLDLRNSGDTAGDRDRVVGYGAFAFYEEMKT